ncbi:MAG: GntR family transcriptional regulator [Salinarimonadaceae bacterium]|nr:MAG: GntR family transcriptional regulator [Salinarimonadaceae bacterium]
MAVDMKTKAGKRVVRNPRRGARLTPLYQQVYVALREELGSGGLDPARPLPSEPALAERFSVSRITIRKTLEQLENEGLVRRVRGVGTFPVPGLTVEDRIANISGFLENLLSFERSTTAETLSWEMLPEPPKGPAALLGDGPCLRIVRLRSYRGRPISFTTICVPQVHAGLLDRETAADTPVIHLLEARGVVAERTEQAISAVAAEDRAAALLGVPPGSPLIAMRRLMLDVARAPVLHQESLYAPDRFEYRMTLTRTHIGPVARWTPIA